MLIHAREFKVARLDFLGGNLPSLSINYVSMSKDIEKYEICRHGPNYMQKL